MAKRKKPDGIVTPGTEGCIHFEVLRYEEEMDNHLIGRCRHCPRVKDYTVLQDWRGGVIAAKRHLGGKASRGAASEEDIENAVYSD